MMEFKQHPRNEANLQGMPCEVRAAILERLPIGSLPAAVMSCKAMHQAYTAYPRTSEYILRRWISDDLAPYAFAIQACWGRAHLRILGGPGDITLVCPAQVIELLIRRPEQFLRGIFIGTPWGEIQQVVHMHRAVEMLAQKYADFSGVYSRTSQAEKIRLQRIWYIVNLMSIKLPEDWGSNEAYRKRSYYFTKVGRSLLKGPNRAVQPENLAWKRQKGRDWESDFANQRLRLLALQPPWVIEQIAYVGWSTVRRWTRWLSPLRDGEDYQQARLKAQKILFSYLQPIGPASHDCWTLIDKPSRIRWIVCHIQKLTRRLSWGIARRTHPAAREGARLRDYSQAELEEVKASFMWTGQDTWPFQQWYRLHRDVEMEDSLPVGEFHSPTLQSPRAQEKFRLVAAAGYTIWDSDRFSFSLWGDP